MIKTLHLLYLPDVEQECKDNTKLFLQNLYFGNPNADNMNLTQNQKDYVYNSIKNFAEMNQKAYYDSNLIELMNQIVADRRGEIF